MMNDKSEMNEKSFLLDLTRHSIGDRTEETTFSYRRRRLGTDSLQ